VTANVVTVRPATQEAPREIRVILNRFDDLKRRVPLN
jgi:hypothetical protein